MGRPLTPEEAAFTLRRGAQIEQFLSLSHGRLRFLVAYRSRDDGVYRVTLHHVYDDDFGDIAEYQPVDREEEHGSGRRVGTFEIAADAVASAAEHGGAADRWVNFGMAVEDYERAKRLVGGPEA